MGRPEGSRSDEELLLQLLESFGDMPSKGVNVAFLVEGKDTDHLCPRTVVLKLGPPDGNCSL